MGQCSKFNRAAILPMPCLVGEEISRKHQTYQILTLTLVQIQGTLLCYLWRNLHAQQPNHPFFMLLERKIRHCLAIVRHCLFWVYASLMMVLYGLKYLPGNICKMTAEWADFTVRTKIQPTVYYNILQILSKNIISATNNAH